MEILDGLKILLINHRIEYEASPFDKPHINNHDLTIVTKGTLYYTVDGESIVVNEGEAIYCPAGVTLCRDKSSIASYLAFNFTTKRNEPLPLNTHITGVLSGEINGYIELIHQVLRKSGIFNDDKLSHLTKLLLLRLFEQQEGNSMLPYVDKIKAYISENYQHDITLDTVSSHVNLHPSYCSTIFKRNEGRSVTEYINYLRISKAKELLKNTQYRVGEIGRMCGIPDPYYFSRVFSKICGTPPLTYRKITKAYSGEYYTYEK